MKDDMKAKYWFESKTLWFNIVMTIVDILALATDMQIGGQPLAIPLAFAHGAGNVILRIWFTDSPIV